VGSSSTRLWKTLARDFPRHEVIHRGFGGSEIGDIVRFADRIVIPYRPSLIVLQAGGNDISNGKSPESVLADFKALVEKVRARLPGARIAFTNLHPSPLRWAQAEKQKEANRLVREYTSSAENLDFIELWDQFLGPDGKPREDLFESDRLHNNAEGYRIRAEAVRPHVEGHAPAAPEPIRVIRAQEEAWNRGDIDGFMDGYDRSEKLTFSSDRGVTRGWEAVRERYRKRYPDRAAMGTLAFSKLELVRLGPDGALVTGEWRLERAGDSPGGVFSVVLERLPAGWKIVHDHTSAFARE
jgi:lysophospholipase L1-like esterase/ketosteroid isomerase-like protein